MPPGCSQDELPGKANRASGRYKSIHRFPTCVSAVLNRAFTHGYGVVIPYVFFNNRTAFKLGRQVFLRPGPGLIEQLIRRDEFQSNSYNDYICLFICRCMQVCAPYFHLKSGAFNCPIKEIPYWTFTSNLFYPSLNILHRDFEEMELEGKLSPYQRR